MEDDEVVSFIQAKIDSAKRMNEKTPGIIESRWFNKLEAAKKTYQDYVETYGEDYPIVLIKEQPEVELRPWYGAVIAPSAKYEGEWQATYFDQRGFSGDFVSKSRGEAYWDIYYQGITKPAPEVLDQVAMTDLFQAGNLWTMMPQEERDKLTFDELLVSVKGNEEAKQVTLNALVNTGFYLNAFPGHHDPA